MSRIKKSNNSRKDRAIIALFENPTLEKAAQAVGVHPSTLRRWLREPEFQEKVRQANRERYAQSMRLLHLGTAGAVSNLLKLTRDPAQPGSTQVRAIDTLLNRVTKLIEIEDVLARLTELERRINGGP